MLLYHSLSLSTVCRIVKYLNITYKQINNYLVCKDIKLVEEDRRKYAIENSKNINKCNNSICIDESGFNIDDIVNKGYSTVGTLINKLIKHKHNKMHWRQ